MGLFFLLASSGPSQADSRSQSNPTSPPVTDLDVIKECAAELYAYSKVEMLGRKLGRDADVVADAVAVLGEQLDDCLDYVGADDTFKNENPRLKTPASLHHDRRGI